MKPEKDLYAKQPNETHLQWQTRIATFEAILRTADGPLVTPEAEQHAQYDEQFVMHVESNTLARTRRVNRGSVLEDMRQRGIITDEQFDAAGEIIGAVNLVERDVSVRSASLEARVDNSGSAKGVLIERLAVIRAQLTYSAWRNSLPVPRRLIIDMLVQQQSMKATARSYGVGWPLARKRLLRSLDNWTETRRRVAESVDEDEVIRIYDRLGGGVIV